MKFAFPFLSPYLLFPFLSPIICHVLSSCFHSTTFHCQRCCSTSYQNLYPFNFRLGRLQSFVSKANNISYLSLGFLLPEALHSLAQPCTAERNVIAQFSLRHYVWFPQCGPRTTDFILTNFLPLQMLTRCWSPSNQASQSVSLSTFISICSWVFTVHVFP